MSTITSANVTSDYTATSDLVSQIMMRLTSMEDDRGIAANVKALDFSLMEIQLREI